MKRRISFRKKVELFLSYRKIIKRISFDLENSLNARIDGAYRIYTVLNIPASLIEEPYNLRKEDIDNLAKNYIRDYSVQLSNFLNKNNLFELYDFYEAKKVDKYSYLLIFGFSLFDSQIFMRNFYITLISLLTAIVTIIAVSLF